MHENIINIYTDNKNIKKLINKIAQCYSNVILL
jgi:hypothetical protein